jgi:fructose-bisphosphate aldolase class II
MTKINIGTALNIALTASVRAGLAADPAITDPRRYLGSAREAMSGEALRLLDVLG